MANRRLPDRSPTILTSLTVARDAYLTLTHPADRALSAETFAQLDTGRPESLLSQLLDRQAGVNAARADQAAHTAALKAAAGELRLFISHFHQVLDFAIARRQYPPAARGYFQRDATSTKLPKLTGYNDLAEAARAIIEGEPKRQADYPDSPPMTNPGMDEIRTRYEAFQPLHQAAKQRKAATDKAREALAALLPAARDLARDIADTVEFHYRKDKDRSSRRAKCARWGVVYR